LSFENRISDIERILDFIDVHSEQYDGQDGGQWRPRARGVLSGGMSINPARLLLAIGQAGELQDILLI
jgi:hypothetical protein